MNCPICNRPITSDEKLVLVYYTPKDWWVTRHLIPDMAGDTVMFHDTTLMRFKVSCARAAIQTVIDKR